jgi:hypothetical protein
MAPACANSLEKGTATSPANGTQETPPPAGERTQPRRTRPGEPTGSRQDEGTDRRTQPEEDNRQPATQRNRHTNQTRSAPAPCPKPALRSVCQGCPRAPRDHRAPTLDKTRRPWKRSQERGGDNQPNRTEQPDDQSELHSRQSRDDLDSRRSRNELNSRTSHNELDSQQAETTWAAGKPQTTRPSRRPILGGRSLLAGGCSAQLWFAASTCSRPATDSQSTLIRGQHWVRREHRVRRQHRFTANTGSRTALVCGHRVRCQHWVRRWRLLTRR